MLFLLLIVGVVIYSFQLRQRIHAISWLCNLIKGYATPQEFTQNITDIDIEVRKRWGRGLRRTGTRLVKYKKLVLYGENESRHFKLQVTFSTPKT